MPKDAKLPPSTMDAPKPSRGDERTEEIVRTASELFLEQGFEHTSIDQIIQKTGGSKAHVYRKFKGKEGLFLACIEYLCDEIQLSIETPGISDQPAAIGLRIMAQALVHVLLGERHVAFQRMVFAEAARFPRVGEIWFRRGPQTTGSIFRNAIEHWMHRGELRHGDAGLVANLFCDMLSGHILDRTWLGIGKKSSRPEVKRTIDTAIRLFLEGFGAQQAAQPIKHYR